jgi:predicted Zn-dependent protease
MRRPLFALIFAVGAAASVAGFVLFNDVWPDGTVTMNLQLGSSGRLTDGSTSWGASAESALASWNQYIGRVKFTVVRDSTAAKGDGNNVNNVLFSSDLYGRSFGTGVLAVTTNWARRSTRTEGDVIFNAAYTWDSYGGNLRSGVQDFHRVALHEFGHILGLDHPDESGQTVSAIMNSHISNLDQLTSDDIAGAQALYGGVGTTDTGSTSGGAGTVAFPPRNESLDFRSQLEAKYRDGLRRGPTATSVDIEGDVVWTQEYERYRVNQCSHADAVSRVMVQIDGVAAPGVCGAAPPGRVQFPPQNESVDFRNQLEAKYRDGLRRLPVSTSVDLVGDVVWTQEYLRYRVNGCGHAIAVQNVLVQIDGFPAPAVCR